MRGCSERGSYTAQWRGLKVLPSVFWKISCSSSTSTHVSWPAEKTHAHVNPQSTLSRADERSPHESYEARGRLGEASVKRGPQNTLGSLNTTGQFLDRGFLLLLYFSYFIGQFVSEV